MLLWKVEFNLKSTLHDRTFGRVLPRSKSEPNSHLTTVEVKELAVLVQVEVAIS